MFFVGHYRVIAVTFWAISLSQRLFAYNLSYGIEFITLTVRPGAPLQAYTCKPPAKPVQLAFERSFV
jgi:hypothetical protein